ncbi:MAG: ABC-F family ATP-binding cassette domain-containing protein [Acidobacteria bacterium]|nr:ABC-F family ATP-binding cassette domain-containing protein [Acidobacteriota bacterium]
MLFRLAEVTKSYGTQDVLKGVSFQLNPGEHVGLVGRNGAGKTTIFRLINGAESHDHGELERMKNFRVGVLAQHVDFAGADTVLDAALQVFSELIALEARMRELEHDMAEAQGDELERVMHEYSDAQHAFEDGGGFTFHSRAEGVLLGLGFDKDEFGKRAESLSGGEKNRLGLARLLLLEPDILLLDEPTNHLDVDAVEWLEEYLSKYPSAYLIISHDRFFLDHTVTRVLDLEFGKVDSYKGNYTQYLELREERREQQQRAYELQQGMIAKTEDFIRRNLAGQKTKQAKSRRTQLEKIERLESVNQLDTANFKLKPTARTGDQVLMLEDLAVGYGTKVLAGDLNLLLRRGERLGIIGGNGTGKTTLLRTLLNQLPALAGAVRWGSGVVTGYYDQRLHTVDDRNDVLSELRTIAGHGVADGELRGFLGRFLFSGDDVFKSVSSLSGGEKGRLALAKLIYSRVNVLLLDEPTNHLDIASCETLEEALNEYDGTIITVSHDRYFLDRICTKILYFSEGKGAEYFDGGYTEFYEAHHRALAEAQVATAEKMRAEREAEKQAAAKQAASKPASKTNKSRNKPSKAKELETKIQTIEASMDELFAEMATDAIARDHVKLGELNAEYQRLEAQSQQLYAAWEAALAAEVAQAV